MCYRSTDAMKALIRCGVQVNFLTSHYEERALHFAAQVGNLDMVRLLVTQGLDVNALNLWRENPLTLPVMDFHRAVMEYLIRRRASLFRIDCCGRHYLDWVSRSSPLWENIDDG